MSTNTDYISWLLCILHAPPPLHGFLGFKRKPCLHNQVSHLQIYFRLQIRVFFMGMLSPYSLFILYNRYTEAMCLVPKNIVKTGCVTFQII